MAVTSREFAVHREQTTSGHRRSALPGSLVSASPPHAWSRRGISL